MESGRDRMELATEAGYPKVSLASVLAGVLVAYGAFAIIAAIAGGVLNALGVDTQTLSSNDWRQYGIVTGAVAAVSLFFSYLFGGYVAGRMARRGGALNGALVFLFGILLVAGIAAAIGSQADGDAVLSNLRSMGVPTSGDEYAAIGTFAGLGAIVAMLLGSLLGGVTGERWHGKLVSRALDPAVGPSHDDEVLLSDDERTAEVRGRGHHFATTADDVQRRVVDVSDRSTTLDADLSPEHTRTMH
ncbi:MAG TPA: YrzE family protein [Acidimicrobiales bacterium]|nr:YrzE family protein [Acidimicrobiales bacterium]